MYFPFFRAKRFELLAIYEKAELLSDTRKVIPVIEPVNDNLDDLLRNLARYRDAGLGVILIENPTVGDLVGEVDFIHSNVLSDFESYDRLEVGYIIDASSDLDDIRAAVRRNPDRALSLIHRHTFIDQKGLLEVCGEASNITRHIFIDGCTGETYRESFSEFDRVIIKDGFERQERNADYPPTSHFSDLHQLYDDKGYEGFGDFLIVGDHYFAEGGPAHAVAIHLVSNRDDGSLVTRHFVSERTETPRDRAGKYIEAVTRLIHSAKTDPTLRSTSAYREFLEHYRTKEATNLGYVKKLSMIHHLEIMSDRI